MFSKEVVTLQENVLTKSVFGLEIEGVVLTEVNAELNIYLGSSF